MSLVCRCGSPVYALGIPDCSIKMAPIVRMIFTVYENNIATSASDLDLTPTNTTYPDIYRLITPYLSEVSSERAEPVVEEVGATKYFVRQNTRSIKALVPVIPPTFGQFISLLRCQSRLGVFLVDANGVVWGAKQDTNIGFAAKPIPIIPSSVNATFEFPSYTTVKKVVLFMETPFIFEDHELIPVAVGDTYLSYQSPMPVGWRIVDPTVPGPGSGSWRVRFYNEYLTQAGVVAIGIDSIPATDIPNIRIWDASATLVVASGVAHAGDGFYTLSAALTSGTNYILDATTVTAPTLFDWNGVYHRFTAP